MGRPTHLDTLYSDVSGIILWFKPEKGFGFIGVDDHDDVFIHIKSVLDDRMPKKGDSVTFNIVRDQRRNRTYASEVRFV